MSKIEIKLRVNHLFVIGIDNYRHQQHPVLYNSLFDCDRFIKVLTSTYAFSLISDPLYNEKATRANIIYELSQLAIIIQPEDNLIIYFAGHGYMNPITNKGGWIPYDAEFSEAYYIPNSTIKDEIENINAKHIFLISDSCFSGTFLTRTRSTYSELRHYQILDSKSSRWYIGSGTEETVNDGKKGEGSPFCNALLSILTDNMQKCLSVSEIINYISKYIGSVAKQSSIGGPIQISGHDLGEMVLCKNEIDVAQIPEHQISNFIKAYSFYKGQTYTLQEIKRKHLILNFDVTIAQFEWNNAFSTSLEYMKKSLQDFFKKNWRDIDLKLETLIKDHVDVINENANIEDLVEFISEVRYRAKGNMPLSMGPIFITNIPEIKVNPILEYIKGFKQELVSDEYEKSKGLKFKIDIPISWQVQEGKRPNVLWLTKSFAGNIISTCLVNLISKIFNVEFDDALNISPDETTEYILNEENLRDANSWANPTNTLYRRIMIDGCNASIYEFDGYTTRVEFTINFFARVYYILYNDHLIVYTFQVTKFEDAYVNKEEYRNFFNLVMNSLIMVSKYE